MTVTFVMILIAGDPYCTSIKMMDNYFIYNARILFRSKCKPDPRKFILWTDSIHLTDFPCYSHGPFYFDSHSNIIIAKQYIALTR